MCANTKKLDFVHLDCVHCSYASVVSIITFVTALTHTSQSKMSRYTPWHDNDDLELAPLSQQREEQQHDTTSHRKLATHDLLAWVTTIINDHRLVTTGVIALAAVMEKLDEQLLPSVYPYVARSLRASPAALGYLTLSRALVQSISSPLGGLLGVFVCVGVGG